MTNDYIRDGVGVTDPVLADSGATYTPGISERRGGVTSYVHSGLKNADAQSGSSQTVSATRKYDAWGNTRSSSGTWNGPFGHAGGFGYQSSDRSGLQLLGHRYYDPETGRFLTRDPIKSGQIWHSYGAGSNSPVSGVDPTGLDKLIVHQNPGGAGLGSHVVIGLQDGEGKIIWSGFYPLEAGRGGSSARKRAGKGKGPGHVKLFEEPLGENRAEVDISSEERKAIQKAIYASAQKYGQGKGKPYALGEYNCADWALEMILAGVGGSDGVAPKPKKKASGPRTPKDIKDWIESWPRS